MQILRVLPIVAFHLYFAFFTITSAQDSHLGSARVVFQTNYGDIEFGFFPKVAPKTVDHIFKLVRLGCYNTNHFFRVDKGFVAQVADVVGGRLAPMNEEQKMEAEKTVVGEFSDVKHVRGILSMGRYDDPDSAQSSFSMLLGDAPHLDGKYAIFGKVTKGDDTLKKLEELPTRREGIFVMELDDLAGLGGDYWIIGGDFNVTRWSWEKSHDHSVTSNMRLFKQWIAAYNLRGTPLKNANYTWSSSGRSQYGSLID